MGDAGNERKQRGAWFTPEHLVDAVVTAVIDEMFVGARHQRALSILDPACGDGRFLTAAVDAVRAAGGDATAVGVDIDAETVRMAPSAPGVEIVCADALTSTWLAEQAGTFDLVIGNPPFLSQMASSTTRGGASTRGGGPYADAAVEFLALAADMVDPDGGRVAFVLPQSILSARDAGAVRDRIDRRADMIWSTWTGERDFDAEVVTCALAFEFSCAGAERVSPTGSRWSHVVTGRTGVPPMPTVFDTSDPARGRLGDRARLNANFRDEYYGMIPAVGDHETGPPLITSGLIDPGRCWWGERSVRFAKRRFIAPRIDLAALDPRMSAWADKRLVPKVLIANQTPIVEAVCDPSGDWLPGVPVVAAYPLAEAAAATDAVVTESAWEIATVLVAPSVSVWAWHQRGGTGLSSNAIRLGPTMLAELPWPTGRLDGAVAALRAGDVVESGRLVDRAYGLDESECAEVFAWWSPIFERIAARAN
ncbi:HsdM family class I SAM-dependent methyltransferase [Ilumatobacter nonamiensis]|uniref:HsdM family class I SAM-dependent methyltransferase n=1 Tax=Ilumatobacter nonamiensis TaxID=467093 RepID=UPI0003450C81|nr:N-6 DNA methylase [Ilumatobacter nonamiensis]